jgi:hypothetical protein
VSKSEVEAWLGQFGDPASSRFRYRRSSKPSCGFCREAESKEIVISRDRKPAGLLIGFGSEEDWLDYQLENDPRFLRRIEQAPKSLRAGRGVRIEDAR